MRTWSGDQHIVLGPQHQHRRPRRARQGWQVEQDTYPRLPGGIRAGTGGSRRRRSISMVSWKHRVAQGFHLGLTAAHDAVEVAQQMGLENASPKADPSSPGAAPTTSARRRHRELSRHLDHHAAHRMADQHRRRFSLSATGHVGHRTGDREVVEVGLRPGWRQWPDRETARRHGPARQNRAESSVPAPGGGIGAMDEKQWVEWPRRGMRQRTSRSPKRARFMRGSGQWVGSKSWLVQAESCCCGAELTAPAQRKKANPRRASTTNV